MEREYYSIPEAAALLGLSRIAVFKKVKKGQLPALRFGRNWAVPAAALEAAASAGLTRLPVPNPSPKKGDIAKPAAARAAGPGPEKKERVEQAPPPSDAEMDSMGWD